MKNQIRVLHILDELNTGGAERIVFSYFQKINRDLFQWDFVITRYADTRKRGMLEDLVEELGGKIYRVTRKRENYIKNINEISHIIKKGNYDIVHSHLDELSSFYLLSAKKARVPVRICHSHLAGTDRGMAIEILCKLLRPMMFRCTTDKFACGIEAGKALWGEKAIDNGSVHIMKNAIQTDLFKFDQRIRDEKRRELNIESDMVFGSVGRLSYQKNSLFLIEITKEIVKKNPHAVMFIVGEGDLESEMRNKVKEYSLENNVQFLGGRSDVNELMMAMDVFLLPSRFEGLPIVLVEAQCSGLSCCVSDKVTDEVKMLDNTKWLSIDSAKDWADLALNIARMENRALAFQIIKKEGYDINVAAQDLQGYYMKAVQR